MLLLLYSASDVEVVCDKNWQIAYFKDNPYVYIVCAFLCVYLSRAHNVYMHVCF